MPSRKIEQQLEILGQLRKKPPNEETLAALRKALSNPVNVVAARAAAIAEELQLTDMLSDLARAFQPLFEKGRARDPQCWAKNAIAKALKNLGHAAAADFLPGVHYVQMEPVWGRQEDTATVLRGTCALALAQCTDRTRDQIFRHLVNAFTDPVPAVREDIARAVELMEGEEAILLLRLKARLGDTEPGVTGQVLESLLRLERAPAVPFAAGFLHSGDELAEEAALALGASRFSAAIEALQKAWTDSPNLPRSALLRALSASRHESALDFLFDIVRTGHTREAIVAIDALAFHRESPEIREKTAAAAESRNQPDLIQYFLYTFQP